jgi:hypothetical protein
MARYSKCAFSVISRCYQASSLDLSRPVGAHEQKMERVREIRDLIKRQMEEWCAEMCVAESAVKLV